MGYCREGSGLMICLTIYDVNRSDLPLASGCCGSLGNANDLIFLLVDYTREIFSKVSTTSKRFLSSSDNTALPGLSTTKDFMPAAMAASTSLTLSLRNRIVSGAS